MEQNEKIQQIEHNNNNNNKNKSEANSKALKYSQG